MKLTKSDMFAMYPNLCPKLSTRHLSTTYAMKRNGNELGAVVDEGFTIMDKLATLPSNHPKITELVKLGQTSPVPGNTWDKIALTLCGRWEEPHNTGISINVSIAGKDHTNAVRQEAKAIGQGRAHTMLSNLRALSKMDAPATSTRRMKKAG